MAVGRKRFLDHLDSLANYENKLIRVAKDKVYWVRGGTAMYVPVLPFTDELSRKRDWNEVIELSSMPGDNRNTIVDLINKIPTGVKQTLAAKGEQLFNAGISKINPTDPSLLPYNASVKNAINTANGMTEGTPISIRNTTIYIVLGVVVVVGLIIYLRK